VTQKKGTASMLRLGYPRPIAVALATLFVDTTANTAIIFDRQGQVLAGQGDCLRPDLKQQAALIAGTLRSSHEVELLTDRADDGMLITLGARENLICAEVTSDYILALMLPKDVPVVRAKQRTKQGIQEVRTLLTSG
jgi:Roadblock/LC7 domain